MPSVGNISFAKLMKKAYITGPWLLAAKNFNLKVSEVFEAYNNIPSIKS